MKTVIIVQARMGSTRLSGKVLKTVLGKTLLEYQIERLKNVEYAEEIIIATTDSDADLPIVEQCKTLSIPVFRGSEEDVLARYYGAASEANTDVVVRVTGDCPIIDHRIIDRVIKHYLDNITKFDYVSNCLERTYPRGMDTEVFSRKALECANRKAESKHDREHVTPFIYNNRYEFRVDNIAHLTDLSAHRWTVDTIEDLNLITQIIERLYPDKPDFSMEDVLSLLSNNPELQSINKSVMQKELCHE